MLSILPGTTGWLWRNKKLCALYCERISPTKCQCLKRLNTSKHFQSRPTKFGNTGNWQNCLIRSNWWSQQESDLNKNLSHFGFMSFREHMCI
jgi:hypothetical protein